VIRVEFRMSEDVAKKLYEIKPRSIVYLFSGGKDSALALALTRSFVKRLCEEIKCKVYIVYIYMTGNTHPLNAYCAQYVLKWHEINYGFTPAVLASNKLFTDYMCKYGFEILRGRWCYTEFKEKHLREFEYTIPKPVVEIDGMSPGDSLWRSEIIDSEVQEIRTNSGRHYWSWHPLFSLKLDSKRKLEMLKQYKEFECVVKLYEIYGDSMNCTICPYKSKEKLMKLNSIEPGSIYYSTIDICLRSDRWKDRFSVLNNEKKITDFIRKA
jgi:3'-phosphoadenosine 5'-phosphosulfate sulfotransferase (PAPS reductase)/FAD synthetase